MSDLILIESVDSLNNKEIYNPRQSLFCFGLGCGFFIPTIIEKRLERMPIFYNKSEGMHYKITNKKESINPIISASLICGCDKNETNLNITKESILSTFENYFKSINLNKKQSFSIICAIQYVINKNFYISDNDVFITSNCYNNKKLFSVYEYLYKLAEEHGL